MRTNTRKTKFLLLLNHTLTQGQREDAVKRFGELEFVSMPEQQQRIWSGLPAEQTHISPTLEGLRGWIDGVASAGDYIMVQGDPGGCYLMAEYAFKQGLIPVYSTTKRKVAEHHQADGSVLIQREFSHELFRKYGD